MFEFNGISMIPNLNWEKPDFVFKIDVCLRACGGWKQKDGDNSVEYFHSCFPGWIQEENINIIKSYSFGFTGVWGNPYITLM